MSSNHQLQQADAKRVDVLQHQHLLLLTPRYLLSSFDEWPEVGVSRHGQFQAAARREVGQLVDRRVAVH